MQVGMAHEIILGFAREPADAKGGRRSPMVHQPGEKRSAVLQTECLVF